jgi:UDP-glucose 4-epimerase
MKNWLITGGCGFIGLALLRRLQDEPDAAVRIVDNLSVGTREELGAVGAFREIGPDQPGDWSGVGLLVGDILDEGLAVRAAQGADVIVHLAANTGVPASIVAPRQDMQANVVGTFNYLEAARIARCPNFVFASSGATVGECTPPVHEEMPSHPVSPYGASKLAGEGYLSAYHAAYGLAASSLRFGNVYGPGSGHKTSVVAAFLKQAFAGKPLVVHGAGTQTRDFIYIDDIVSAIMAAATTPAAAGQAFQIATNKEHSVLELAEMLMEILAGHGLTGVTATYEQARAGDVRRNFSDTSKAARLLGWRPDYELRKGLELTVKWFMSQSLG